MNTPNPTPLNEAGDTRLLLIVAGCVVAGAAALAMLAGYAARTEAESTEVADSPRRVPVRASDPVGQVVPAVSVPVADAGADGIEPALKIPGSMIDADVAGSSEPTFEIDPDADFVAEGHAAWHARDFERATAYFSAACEESPEDAGVRYMLGLSAWKNGDLAAAVVAMERALELNPASLKSAVNLARIRNDAGAYDEALLAADKAIEIDPESGPAHFLRARSLYNLGRVEPAIEAIETSLGLDEENGHAHNLLGLIRLQQDDETRALAALERAAELAPDTAYVHNNLGMALERSGRTREALAAYEVAVAVDPGHANAALNAARLTPLVPETVDPMEGETLLAGTTAEPVPESEAVVEIAEGGGGTD